MTIKNIEEPLEMYATSATRVTTVQNPLTFGNRMSALVHKDDDRSVKHVNNRSIDKVRKAHVKKLRSTAVYFNLSRKGIYTKWLGIYALIN